MLARGWIGVSAGFMPRIRPPKATEFPVSLHTLGMELHRCVPQVGEMRFFPIKLRYIRKDALKLGRGTESDLFFVTQIWAIWTGTVVSHCHAGMCQTRDAHPPPKKKKNKATWFCFW